eukprot:1155990-Pelagomonas_calceolata.AAC.1
MHARTAPALPYKPSLYAPIRASFSCDPRLAPGSPLYNLLALPEGWGDNSPTALFDRLFDASFQSKSSLMLPDVVHLRKVCNWIIHFLHLRHQGTAGQALPAIYEQHNGHSAQIRNPQGYAWRLFTKKAGKPAYELGLEGLERAYARNHDVHMTPSSQIRIWPWLENCATKHSKRMNRKGHDAARACTQSNLLLPSFRLLAVHLPSSCVCIVQCIFICTYGFWRQALCCAPHSANWLVSFFFSLPQEAHRCEPWSAAYPRGQIALTAACTQLLPVPAPQACLASCSSCRSVRMNSDSLSLLSGSDDDERSNDDRATKGLCTLCSASGSWAMCACNCNWKDEKQLRKQEFSLSGSINEKEPRWLKARMTPPQKGCRIAEASSCVQLACLLTIVLKEDHTSQVWLRAFTN